MYQSVPSIRSVFTCSYGRSGAKKEVKLRTAFKSNTTNAGLGEIEGLLYRNANESWVYGYKTLPRPLGPPLFEKDYFSRKATNIWVNPKAPIDVPSGLVCFNTEPGLWVLSPAENMKLADYTKLLNSLNFEKLALNQRKPESGFGEKDFPKVNRDGLEREDQLVIGSIERFIQALFQRAGFFQHADEFSHFEHDLARLRIYHRIYREKPNSLHDIFINAGSFRRAISNGIPVLRPTSELIRMALLNSISQLEQAGKRSEKEKNHNKSKLLLTDAEDLKTIVKTWFPIQSEAVKESKSAPSLAAK
jgi:hypothetical protein